MKGNCNDCKKKETCKKSFGALTGFCNTDFEPIEEQKAGVYTREQWAKDGDFKPEIGQEITKELYNYFYDLLPPLNLAAGQPLSQKLKISCGYRIGEPYTHAESKRLDSYGEFLPFFAAFGRTASGKYYFLGNQNKYGEIFDPKRGEVMQNRQAEANV